MTPSKILFFLCISFIVGIFLSSLFGFAQDKIIKIPQILVWGFLILGMVIIFISLVISNNGRPSIIKDYGNYGLVLGFCMLVLVLGVIRFQISEFNILNDKLSKFNDKSEKIILFGQISVEPDPRDILQKLKIKEDYTGSIVLVTTQRYPEYKYLDKIKITGKLKTPKAFGDFNYKNYLIKDGIYSVMDFPKIELVSTKHNYNALSFLYEKILFLKSKLINSINFNFSPPQSSILEGVVFGNDKNMPKDLKDKFNATGLSHLTAVSGSNIVILISIVMVFLLFLGFWRGQAFYFVVILILIYIALIGFPISGIRAAIMGSIAILAEKLGRQNTSSRVLVIAAAIMLLQNPLLLFYDVSFQLSFLASLGIIYLKSLIDNFLALMLYVKKQTGNDGLKIDSKNKFKFLLDIISITLAAQIFTLPIIVYNFGSISLIAPVTNILVLPIVPLLTILGFIVSILGIFSNILGFIFSIPCLFLMVYFVKILDIFSQPWAVKTIENISWLWLVVYYVVLTFLIKFLQKYQKSKFLGY